MSELLATTNSSEVKSTAAYQAVAGRDKEGESINMYRTRACWASSHAQVSACSFPPLSLLPCDTVFFIRVLKDIEPAPCCFGCISLVQYGAGDLRAVQWSLL